MVLEYSHRAATFRDFRGEASGSPSLARSDLAVPNQGHRRGAFATPAAALETVPVSRFQCTCNPGDLGRGNRSKAPGPGGG